MTEQRPDTDERDDPGGTPSPGQENLTARPAIPGDDGAGTRPCPAPTRPTTRSGNAAG